MANERMTLIERLRNPAWESVGPGEARLDKNRAIDTMREAASTIEQLRATLEQIINPLVAAEEGLTTSDRRVNSLAWLILNSPENLKAMARAALGLKIDEE